MARVATAEKKVKGFSVDDVLASAASKTEKASKSKTPEVSVPKEVRELVARLRDVKAELDSNQSMFETLSAELIEHVATLRAELCAHGYVSSVKVPGANGAAVSVSWSASYSKTDPAWAEELASIVGDGFDDLFTTEMSISVKVDASEEMLSELIEAVGPERFKEFFEVARWLKPTARYTEGFFTAFDAGQREKLSGIVRQYKPSVRVK